MQVRNHIMPTTSLHTKCPTGTFHIVTPYSLQWNWINWFVKSGLYVGWCGLTLSPESKSHPDGWWNSLDPSYRKTQEILSSLQNWIGNSLHQ